MKPLLLVAFFTSVGCAYQAPVLFTTPCGVEFVGNGMSKMPEPDETIWRLARGHLEWTPEHLAWYENKIFDVFQTVVGPNDSRFADRDSMCAAVKGYQLYMNPEPNWYDNGRRVAGLTNCAYGNVMVGNVPPDRSSLPHELAHVIQRCDWDSYDHKDWGPLGIYVADYQLTSDPPTCNPTDKSCIEPAVSP